MTAAEFSRHSAGSKTNYGEIGPQAAFVGLFFSLFAYHALGAFEVITPAWPWWTCTLLVTLILLAPLTVAASDAQAWRRHLPVMLFAAWIAYYVVWYYYRGEPWQRRWIAVEENGKLLIGLGGLYCTGFLLRNGAGFRRALLVCLALMVVATPFLIRTDALAPDWDTRSRFEAIVASNVWFAQSIAFVAMAAIALNRDVRVQMFAAAAAATALFLLGSRSELIGFALVLILWLSASPAVRAGHMALLTAATASVALITVVMAPEIVSRYAELFNLGKSGSWVARNKNLSDGLADISQSPLWGVYSGQVMYPVSFGNYIHNALEAWRQFGLCAFLVYVGLSVAAFGRPLIAVIIRRNDSPMWRLSLFVSCYTLALIITTKAVYWALPALAWGLAAARKSNQRPTGATGIRRWLRPR